MKLLLPALLLASALTLPVAAQAGPADKPDSQSLSSEKTPPAAGPGTTAAPTAEPKSGALSDSAKENTDSGTNPATDPTAKPASSDLGSKKSNN